MTPPDIPGAIFNLALDDADLTYHGRCAELWVEVVKEVRDEAYLGRAHHNTGTYDRGCRGPLCIKALRENPRRRTAAGNPLQLREERIYDPVLEYFHTVAKHRIRTKQQEIIRDIKENIA